MPDNAANQLDPYGIEIILPAAIINENQSMVASIRIILSTGEKISAENQEVVWRSMDESIITISGDGLIKGIKAGVTDISGAYRDHNTNIGITVERPFDYSKLMISEVFYDAAGTDSSYEFIEILNSSTDSCNISGFRILDGNGNSAHFVFPEGSVIEPGRFIIVASSKDGFYSMFGYYPEYYSFSFALNNSGETLTLVKPDNSTVDEIFIEGGYLGVVPVEWGSAFLPEATQGKSVARESYNDSNSYSDWITGDPSPGTN